MGMTRDCNSFREMLGGALEASLHGSGEGLRVLGWHEHLLACEACRELLEQEEALELLLASLPDPVLPPQLAERLLARLRDRREAGLDALLDLDHVEPPPGLARDVCRGLARDAMETRLDALLDRAGELPVPAGLAGSVLAGLQRARRSRRGGPLLRLSRSPAWRAALAAGLLIGLSWALWGALGERPGQTGGGRQVGSNPVRHESGPVDPDEAIIAWLPALEYWEEVRSLDPLEAQIIEHMDDVDATLLEEGG